MNNSYLLKGADQPTCHSIGKGKFDCNKFCSFASLSVRNEHGNVTFAEYFGGSLIW